MERHFQVLRQIWNKTQSPVADRQQHDSPSSEMAATTLKKTDFTHAHALALQLAASPAFNLQQVQANLVDSGYSSEAGNTPSPQRSPNNDITNGTNPMSKQAISNVKPKDTTHKPPASSRSTPKLAPLPRFAPMLPPSLDGARTPGGRRIPPTIVTRHMPLPIQNLPTLPPIALRQDANAPPDTSRPSLRSVPSLPLVGNEDRTAESEMEGIEEEDEDEDDIDEDDADIDTRRSSSSSTPSEPNVSPPPTHTKPVKMEESMALKLPNDVTAGGSKVVSDPHPTITGSQFSNSEGLATPRPATPLGLSTSTSHHDKAHELADYFSFDTSSDLALPTIVTTAASPNQSVGPSVTALLPRGDQLLLRVHSSAPSEPNANTKSTLAPHGSHASIYATLAPPTATSASSHSPRPGIYRQQSRSMTNLLSSAKPPAAAMSTVVLSASDSMPTPQLRRQASLPSMNPPQYTPIGWGSGFKVRQPQPREEEGMEPLPPYELTLPILEAMLPRKMEFSGPGKKAEDRRWKRVWCVLHGTSFKVYEGEKGWEKVGGWLGRHVKDRLEENAGPSAWRGKGKERDVPRRNSMQRVTAVTSEEIDVDDRPKFLAAPSIISASSSSVSSQPDAAGTSDITSRSSFSSVRSEQPPSSWNSLASSRTSMSGSRLSLNETGSPRHRRSLSQALQSFKLRGSSKQGILENSTSSLSTSSLESPLTPSSPCSANRERSTTVNSSTSSLSPTASTACFPDVPGTTDRALLRHYTLQKAESGIAIDYLKKPNVIRVRLEGEQFLLQAPNVKDVVDWIEGFQSAADIALDLDERVMPRGPIFPRRRRRRRPRPATDPIDPSNTEGTTPAITTNRELTLN